MDFFPSLKHFVDFLSECDVCQRAIESNEIRASIIDKAFPLWLQRKKHTTSSIKGLKVLVERRDVCSKFGEFLIFPSRLFYQRSDCLCYSGISHGSIWIELIQILGTTVKVLS